MDEFDEYFIWLMDLVNADTEIYSELLYVLYDTDFTWCLELDDGRASDGLKLRDEYAESMNGMGFDASWVLIMEKPCSVLEMLIALARRMDDMLIEDYMAPRIPIWFWEMVRNLGLKKYMNAVLLNNMSDDYYYDIQEILSRWLNREFEPDGSGSIFPLKNPYCDQRDKTIVYQLNAYVLENYVEE